MSTEMTDWNTLTTLLSPICGIVVLLMGIYAYYRNPHTAATQMFLFVTGMAAMIGMLDFLFRNAPDEGSALILGKALIFAVVVLFAAVLYLSTFLPYEKYSGWFSRSKREFVVIAFLAGYASVATVTKVAKYDYGWGATLDGGLVQAAIIALAYIAITVYMLTNICLSTGEKRVRRQCTWLSLAVVSPALYTFAVAGSNLAGLGLPLILSPGFIVFAVVFLYAVLRYQPFAPSNRSERVAGNARMGELIESSALLIEEKQPSAAYIFFNEKRKEGGPTLLITRTHPQVVKERYKVEGIPILWLATQAGPDRLDPANLSILQHNITEFLRRNHGGTVMLDGIEYLLTENPPEKVVRMMQSLRDEVIMNGALLIIPVDPNALDEKRRSMLEREFEVLVPKEGAGTEI